jgi:predicted PurR-regulated permease PerM
VQAPSPSPRQLAQVLTLLRILLILIFVVMGWVVLSYLTGVLAPILAALGIAYLLNPVLDHLVRRGFSRPLGAGLLLVTFLGAIALAIAVATPKIAHQLSDFVTDLPEMVHELDGWLASHFGFEIPRDWREYLASTEVRDALGHTTQPMQRLAEAALGGIFGVLGVLAESLLVPVFAYYFLVDWPRLLRRVDQMVPPRNRGAVRELATEIDRVIANWVRGQAMVTSILAVLYALCFTIVGMPLSVPIGLVVGALTIIPFVGTFVGAAIAGTVIVASGPTTGLIGAVTAVFLVLHLLEAAVLTPKIVGHRVGLSESGALLAVVAGGKLLGFVGVVLAVPIAATVAVFVRAAVRYYETTAFFGHESDADVVITPAMALILPGTPWTPSVRDDGQPPPEAPTEPADVLPPELGPTGARKSEES